jgi:uncharacterized protein YciI
MAGPTLGPINTGIAIIEAPDEATARRIMDEDPTIASGFATGGRVRARPRLYRCVRGRH